MNTRQTVLKEIRAFASEYAHNIDGRDVVIVEQLLAFLDSPQYQEGNLDYPRPQGGKNG